MKLGNYSDGELVAEVRGRGYGVQISAEERGESAVGGPKDRLEVAVGLDADGFYETMADMEASLLRANVLMLVAKVGALEAKVADLEVSR